MKYNISDYRISFNSNCTYPLNWNSLRKIIYKRANYECEYCGNVGFGLNAHHILPLSKGGQNELNNLVCIYNTCHSILHGRNLDLERTSIHSIVLMYKLDSRFNRVSFEERKLEIDTEISEDEQDFHSIEDNIYDG